MNILVFGGTGTLGKALVSTLKKSKEFRVIAPQRNELNLDDYFSLLQYLEKQQTDWLINAAGHVGGVQYNITNPLDLMMSNSISTLNVLRAAAKTEVKRMFYLAPACVYPRNIDRDVKTEDLWKGEPETTSLPYASSKLFGIELVKAANKQLGTNWKVLIPTNIFGSGDWEHNESGHVVSMLTDKIVRAKQTGGNIEIWGSGNQRRDFLSAKDFSKFVNYVIERNVDIPEITNVNGYGEISIRELVDLICERVDYHGELFFNTSMPEGALRKTLSSEDLDRINYQHKNNFANALNEYIEEYLESRNGNKRGN